MAVTTKTIEQAGTITGTQASNFEQKMSVTYKYDPDMDPTFVEATITVYVKYIGQLPEWDANNWKAIITLNGVEKSYIYNLPTAVTFTNEWTNVLTVTYTNSEIDATTNILNVSSEFKIPNDTGATIDAIATKTINDIEPTIPSMISVLDRQALRNNTASIECKIIVLDEEDSENNIVLTENNSIKDWEYTDDRIVPGKGFIGQFVGRTLSGNLQNISSDFSLNGKEIQLHLGINRPNGNGGRVTTFYNMGNFFVTEPEDNDVTDNTKYDAMDYTKLFNKAFDGDFTDEEFTTSYNDSLQGNQTVTALWVAQYTCKQVGVELATTVFTNYDFQISINPFQAGESCRDVMRAIAQLAFSWVRIGWDNKCYIDFSKKATSTVTNLNTLDLDQYFTLKKVEQTKPINAVGFGMSGIDGETALLVQDNTDGDNCIYLYDNPFLYTYALRLSAVQGGSVLFGLTYMQLETETIGHPWFIGNELINVQDDEENDNYLYPFNKTLKYSGHIRSVISSVDKTEIDTTLGYTSSVEKATRKAEYSVNKQDGIIQQLTSSIQQLDERENNNYQDVLSRFEGYLSDADFTELQNIVTQLQTDTYTKTEVQQIASGVGVDGVKVEAVITETGTFDIDGLLIEKANAKTKGRFNEIGMKIMDATGSSDEELLFAGYDETLNETIVRSKNINVTKYLTIGTKSRIQDFEDGTGIFYIG